MLRNLVLNGVVFLLSGGIFYVSIISLNPLGAQLYLAWIGFYVSLIFGIWSFANFFFFFGAELFSGHKLGDRAFLVAVRRGFLFALLILGFVVLQYFRFLGPLEALLWFMFLGLVEWIFLTSS